MSPLLGHRPSLSITHKENGPLSTTRAQCGMVGANDCKYSREQRLNVPSEAGRSSRRYIFGHPSYDRSMLLSFCDRTPSVLLAGPSSSSICIFNVIRFKLQIEILVLWLTRHILFQINVFHHIYSSTDKNVMSSVHFVCPWVKWRCIDTNAPYVFIWRSNPFCNIFANSLK
jgi:hypothetical protein